MEERRGRIFFVPTRGHCRRIAPPGRCGCGRFVDGRDRAVEVGGYLAQAVAVLEGDQMERRRPDPGSSPRRGDQTHQSTTEAWQACRCYSIRPRLRGARWQLGMAPPAMWISSYAGEPLGGAPCSHPPVGFTSACLPRRRTAGRRRGSAGRPATPPGARTALPVRSPRGRRARRPRRRRPRPAR